VQHNNKKTVDTTDRWEKKEIQQIIDTVLHFPVLRVPILRFQRLPSSDNHVSVRHPKQSTFLKFLRFLVFFSMAKAILHCKKYPDIHGYFVAPGLHYSFDLRIQRYIWNRFQLKYGNLRQNIHGCTDIFYSVWILCGVTDGSCSWRLCFCWLLTAYNSTTVPPKRGLR